MNKNFLDRALADLKQGLLPAAEERREVIALLCDMLNYAAPGADVGPVAERPPASAKPRIALCLGHGRAGDEGAVSVDGTSEEEYNFEILSRVAAGLRSKGHDAIEITYYEGNGYAAAMQWVAGRLLEKRATAAIEFHFNAHNGKAKGHEFMHWNESRGGVGLAHALLKSFDREFPEHPSRGLKPRDARSRGALFLSLTHCPAVIAEPFFGDNDDEWDIFGEDEGRERLVTAYVSGITAWIGGLK